MNRSSKLETVANVSIIVSAIMFCAVLANGIIAQQRAARDVMPYQSGERFESIAGLQPDRDAATLFLFVRSNCRFCNESVPFYRQLVAESVRARVHPIAVVLENGDVGARYLAANGIQVEKTISIQPGQMSRLKGTPTLILVDKNYRVINSWVGKLEERAEHSVIEAVHSAS